MKPDILSKIKVKTPIGLIEVLHSGIGVREISLDQEYTENKAIIDLEDIDDNVSVICHDGPWYKNADDTIKWLEGFFSKRKETEELSLPNFDNPLIDKENFTGKVLRTLVEEFPRGTTVSYAKLAELCGSPKACRAVGQAMRANPLPLLIPCHRVISSSGATGPFMGGKGNNIKRWLVNFERCFPN